MPSPYHKILSKTDRAVAAYLIAQDAGTAANVHPGKRSLDKSLPNITVISDSWLPLPGAPGSCTVKCSVQVKTKAALTVGASDTVKPRRDSDALLAGAGDALNNFTERTDSTELADEITAAGRALAISDPDNEADMAEFKCDEIRIVGGGLQIDEEGTFWMDTIDLELIVRPSTDTEP